LQAATPLRRIYNATSRRQQSAEAHSAPRYDVVERFLGKLPLSGRRPPPWRPRLDLPRKSAPFDPQVRPGIPLCNAGRNADTGKFQQSLSAIQVDMSVVHESVETRLDPEALARSGGRIHVPPPRIGLGWDGTTDAVRRCQLTRGRGAKARLIHSPSPSFVVENKLPLSVSESVPMN